jgi:2-polyprenyl-6-hydroxyphenyl methylase / 3-demethylubiquinone-9 3-methyltransferase
MIKAHPTINEGEVAHFSRLSEQWWNPRGPWATLHKFNEVRLAYIRDRSAAHFGRDPTRTESLQGLRILDIGCGGGILSEPLARFGAAVVGIDPSESSIAVARAHAAREALSIDYRNAALETLAATESDFDVVLAMEVVEHVADFGRFIELAGAMVKPRGLMFVGTLNRTMRSFALAIVGGEYIMGWIPRGTHQWRKFVKPKELEMAMARCWLHSRETIGVTYNLLTNNFQLSHDVSASYMVVGEKAA